MTPNESAWTLDGTLARLRTGTLSGRVDIARPELGLHDLELSGQKLSARLCCITRGGDPERDNVPANNAARPWPLAVADAYVRGDDLVSTYTPSDDWPYTPQVYWRAGMVQSFEELAGAMSLMVSVQTHLLDTWPRILIGSQLRCDELLRVTTNSVKSIGAESLERDTMLQPSTGDCCLLRRLPDSPYSYVEIMPASDFRRVEIRGEDNIPHVSWELFADFLEKGVIRRSRLHCAFVARTNDVELTGACRDAIERSALPLTT